MNLPRTQVPDEAGGQNCHAFPLEAYKLASSPCPPSTVAKCGAAKQGAAKTGAAKPRALLYGHLSELHHKIKA